MFNFEKNEIFIWFLFRAPSKKDCVHKNVFVAVEKLEVLYAVRYVGIKFQLNRWKNKFTLGRTLPLSEQSWAEND